MRCKSSHYSLANLTEPRCPERGRAVDPNNPNTFDDADRNSRVNRNHLILVMLGILVATWISVYLGFRDGPVIITPFGATVAAILVTILLLPVVVGLFRRFGSWHRRHD